jgi:hypothetical protein
MDKQIGYPDYLGSYNTSKLENDYAAVRDIYESIRLRFVLTI